MPNSAHFDPCKIRREVSETSQSIFVQDLYDPTSDIFLTEQRSAI